MPGIEQIDASAPLRMRVGTLVHEMGAFYVRSETWYRITLAEQGTAGPWAKAEADYYAAFDGLVRAALGRSAADPDAVAMVSAMLEPVVFGDLRARGASTAEAADLITDVLCAWLEPREARLRR